MTEAECTAPTRRFLSALPLTADCPPETKTSNRDVIAERYKLLKSRSLPTPHSTQGNPTSENAPQISRLQRAILTLGFTCATALGQRSRIVRRFAFFPPNPPGYKLRLAGKSPKNGDGIKAGCLVSGAGKAASAPAKTLVVEECAFLLNVQRAGGLLDANALLSKIVGCNLRLTSGLLHWQGRAEATCPFVFLWKFIAPVEEDSKSGANFSVLSPRYLKQRPLIIYSHGNNTDIGHNFMSSAQLATRLHVNVLTYDYPAYGAARGKLSEKGCLENLKMCYFYAVHVLKIPPSIIIAYGQSIGSVMTCALAKNFVEYPLAGVVLHSPLSSGLRLVLGEKATNKNLIDVFKNDRAVSRIPWPIQIIHGRKDSLVPLLHGEHLAELARDCSKCNAGVRAYFVKWVAKKIKFGAAIFQVVVDQETEEDNLFEKYWPARVNMWVAQQAGHNDIEILHKNDYFRIMRDFIIAYAQA